jgi:coproporphyrinogen III oxidase
MGNTLSQEQTSFAEKMEQFVKKMEKLVLNTFAHLNGSKDLQIRDFLYEEADYTIQVSRGPVIEKGGFEVCKVKKELPPMIPEPIWSRYLQIDIYPKTPLVGMLHIAMYFSYQADGGNMVGGIMDITPGAIIEEDLGFVKAEMDKVFEKRGLDVTEFRQSLEHGNHKEKLKAACVGVSFFKNFLEINENNFDLVCDAVETFFNNYIKILEKRKDQDFGKAEIDAMFDMRKRWLEKQFFWDPFPSTGVTPYEVWSMQDLPPEVRF